MSNTKNIQQVHLRINNTDKLIKELPKVQIIDGDKELPKVQIIDGDKEL